MNSQTLITLPTSLYPLQTLFKALFIFMSLFNFNYTLVVAFLASLIGVLRVCKNPQLDMQYLQKVLANNHGQNLLWVTLGGIGFVNYLFYSPIVLFFGYGIVEFIRIKYPQNGLNVYGQMIRNNKYAIFQAKTILQFAFLVFIIVTLPFDFGRIVKLFGIGQCLFLKYKVNGEFRANCTTINRWFQQKLAPIAFLSSNYNKLSTFIYGYASRDIQGQ